MLFEEAELVSDRLQRISGTEAILFHMAVSAVPSMGVKPESTKSIAEQFRRLVQRLIGTS